MCIVLAKYNISNIRNNQKDKNDPYPEAFLVTLKITMQSPSPVYQ